MGKGLGKDFHPTKLQIAVLCIQLAILWRGEIPPLGGTMLIILIILLLVVGFGGYRMGPGLGYYGGGGLGLILLIVIILLLLRVI